MAAAAPLPSVYHVVLSLHRSLRRLTFLTFTSSRLFPRPCPLCPRPSPFHSLSPTRDLAVSYPSLLLHIHVLIPIFPHVSFSPSFFRSFCFFSFAPSNSNFQSHTCSCLRGSGPANETQSLIQRRVSPFFLQTSLKIRARKAGVFSPPSLDHSLALSSSLSLHGPDGVAEGTRERRLLPRDSCGLLYFLAWKRHRKTEREQRRISPGFRFPPSMCAHQIARSCPALVQSWYSTETSCLFSRAVTQPAITSPQRL